MNNQEPKSSSHLPPWWKFALAGGFIALCWIALLVFSVRETPESWSDYWRLRPLVVTPLSGAFGGLFFYLMAVRSRFSGWMRILAAIAGLLGYLVAVWLGTVLGLDGTLWN